MNKTAVVSTRFRDHPPGLFYLFFAEMWERFSFYGLRALLVLYMVHDLLYNHERSISIYSTYMALVYTSPIIGGLIADYYLGERKAIILGAILIACGHITLAMPNENFFFPGLAFIISGTGFFKSNISALLGRLYHHGDPRRDAGFTLFYVGINIGSLFATLICGWVGENIGWHYGFSLAAIGMIFGLLIFLRGIKSFKGHGEQPPDSIDRLPLLNGFTWEHVIYIMAFVSVPIGAIMLQNYQAFNYILPVGAVIIIAYMIYLSTHGTKDDRQGILTILVFMFFNAMFWSLFEQAGSSMNLFTDLAVDKNFFGWNVPTTWFQSLNPLFIIIFGPLFAQAWVSLAAKNREPYTPFKFFLGLVLTAIGFGFLAFGAYYPNSAGQVLMIWLILAYLFQTFGELCLSPVGLSMVTKLSPLKLIGTLMGIWMISLAYGHYIAGILARLSATTAEATPNQHLETYASAFMITMSVGFVSAIVLLIISPLLNTVFKREEHMKDDAAR